jgi:hypothetical protein
LKELPHSHFEGIAGANLDMIFIVLNQENKERNRKGFLLNSLTHQCDVALYLKKYHPVGLQPSRVPGAYEKVAT